MARKPAHEELERKVRNVEPGAHLCCIYEREEEHQAVLTPSLRQGVERGEKVLYIVDALTAGEVLSYLSQDGLEVEAHLESGQLAILTADESYLREGVFDPDGMISLLKDTMKHALEEGYSALRVTGEMTWALRGVVGSEKVVEYEAKLNEFFPGSKCLAICQYDRRRFGPEILLDVLATHPIAIIGTEVFENFYYMPAEDFLGPDPFRARLDTWLGSLAERKRAEEALRESENELRHLSSQLLSAQENERKSVAQELHDSIGQTLVAIKFGTENVLKQLPKGASPGIIQPLEAAISMVQNAIQEVRRIQTDLRPPTLDDLGILPTISWFCREFQTIYSGIRIEQHIDPQEDDVPDSLKTIIYRVMQEALINTAKHSKADLVRLSLRKSNGAITLAIEDNGLGFGLEDVLSVERSKRGVGVSSMKERIELSGGSFAIESARGAGTIIRASWPECPQIADALPLGES